MKILQLCLKPPYPPVDGGTMAMNSLTQGLMANGHDVKVLTVCSDKHPVRLGPGDELYARQTDFEAVHIDLSIRPLPAAVALLCGESYNIKRFESSVMRQALAKTLEQHHFDIIHVESLFLTPYVTTIRQHCDTPVVLRAHNVEHIIWYQMTQQEHNPLKRWYLKKLALALKIYELQHINDYDGIACITARDAATLVQLGCRKPVADIPFGLTPPPVKETDTDINTLFHIGSMDWKPNDEAIRWFLAEVWPRVRHEMPQLRFAIAGRKMPPDLLHLYHDGVLVEGEVPDASLFMADKQINIVPLKAGSGIRVKIIEAMSLGKTVISTTVGIQGINCTDGHDILIADTPEQFVDAIRRCVNDPSFCKKIGDNARNLIATQYDTNIISQHLVDFYSTLIK